ncbi:ATP-dependent RNA helicase HrpA [Kribbella sp. CA-293567]|uniref:ATP-dependent RNA helicase HrpA n=1 Tax=Kribbella sp. CA-293567 TaxID=3002436 RepID=UPI0022DE7A14|nr:ATP-dependent RNA helicase HrpA [Kribbella sp. CA-293567]WBQ02137.1 ATP-dependent RNA helicase HrpA [Kribbella sp. CA-293567]
MPEARTESQSPTPATGPSQDPGRPRRPRRRRKKPAGGSAVGTGDTAPPESGESRAGSGGSEVAALAARLEGLIGVDRDQLGRRLERLRGLREDGKRENALSDITARIEQAEQRVEQRRLGVPEIRYPEELPVSQLKDEIAAMIRDHQVVVIAGETGSGKTTQIPKICLELGRGVRGMIGHTQPRRLAARTVAERIAEELDTELGDAIGYAVRFTDKVSDRSLVKLMTDGILLAELQRDRELSRYDTLIIDEAHERSLNIDFILGYLKQLLPRRPDLKVIITSATIDPERFAEHFADAAGRPAPIVEVSGRTYPVETRYRPINDPDDPSTIDRDQTQAILDAVDELAGEAPGDVLVFLSGEREIRDTADALADHNLRNTEILPLYARLSNAEQHRVFQSHGSSRRIVLATNVAETSLTVPGIKYVIDPGTARISRYSHRTKVQHLPIEPVSQASANQRMGRCGRTSDGICIRLYSEEHFDSRPEFTDPEILRTNLASVILQMTAIGLGDIAAFPFIDEPDRRSITDGLQLLTELGAIDSAKAAERTRQLTPVGRQLAQIPLDPRLARMIVEAGKHGCVREVMVIASALSIQDPRERPTDAEAQATQAHARFRDPTSDFLGFLNLWNYLKKQQKELSGNQFRRMCKSEYLNYLRVREWQDIFAQLRQVATQIGVTLNSGEAADPQAVHVSLMSGLLSHLGLKDPANQHQYIGARGAKFAIFPGSALFKKPPQFVMAAELVETSRLWARVNARIEPEWAEDLAQHLVKRSYSEPHWERKAGAVMAYEKVTLYGVPIVAHRKINYGAVDPEVSRELFIRHALVEGDWDTHHKFFHENRKLIEEVEELEERTRRRDLLVDDETLFAFYDERIGAEVVTGRHFDTWWKTARQRDHDLLDFERSLVVREGAEVKEEEFPLTWSQNGMTFDLTYAFEPGTDADGVTVHLPLLVLNQVGADGFEWSVPGFREELVTTLIKSLPKAIRRNIVPAPDHARQILPQLDPASGPLVEAMARELRQLRDVIIDEDDWDWSRVPEHLRMTFRVVDDHGKTVAEGKDLAALKERLKPKTKAAISQVASKAVSGLEKSGLTDWTFGDLPRSFSEHRNGLTVAGYPALVDDGKSVAIRLQETERDQAAAMWTGTRRLLLLTMPSVIDVVQRHLTNQQKMTLLAGPHRSVGDLLDDAISAAVDQLMAAAGGPVWNLTAFSFLRDAVRSDLADTVLTILQQVEQVLANARTVDKLISRSSSPALLAALSDVRGQLEGLVHRGFITEAGAQRLPDLARYLRGIEQRLDKIGANAMRDRSGMAIVQTLTDEYQKRLRAVPTGKYPSPELLEVRWMLEELRISLFAQTLGTPYPVSDKRIRKALTTA